MYKAKDVTCSQMNFLAPYYYLEARTKNAIENTVFGTFRGYILPIIPQDHFACLFSDSMGRPCTPVTTTFGALMLQAHFNWTDDETVLNVLSDPKVQYALGVEYDPHVQFNDRTISRFLHDCLQYQMETGTDLIHDAITSIAASSCEIMGMKNGNLRFDTLLIEANMKKLTRPALLFVSVERLVCYLHRLDLDDHLAEFTDFLDHEFYNRFLYHQTRAQSMTTEERYAFLIGKMVKLNALCLSFDGECGEKIRSLTEYSQLVRIMNEQTIEDGQGGRRLRTKEDGGFSSDMLQNPTCPDATCIQKDKKLHKGFKAGVTEKVSEISVSDDPADDKVKGSQIVAFVFDSNNVDDGDMGADMLRSLPRQEEGTKAVGDALFRGDNIEAAAEETGVELVTTALTGKAAPEIYAEFKFNEDGTVAECPEGNEPLSSTVKADGRVDTRMPYGCCVNCEHREECKAKLHPRVENAELSVSQKSADRAKHQVEAGSQEGKERACFRNGIEAAPGYFRNFSRIDRLPVRDKGRAAQRFGFCVGGLNLKKLHQFLVRRGKCA